MTMRRLYPFLLSLTLFSLAANVSIAQVTAPDGLDKDKVDFSYCRFDSTELALCRQFLPNQFFGMIRTSHIDARMVPLFVTMKDAEFHIKGDTLRCKILYATDGMIFGSLKVLAPAEDGSYFALWESQSVPPAGNVKVQLRDLTADGRPDIIATSRGGMPILEALAAFDFDGHSGRELVSRASSPTDQDGMLGVGIAVIDSLGRNGRPAIEVWQDEPSHQSAQYVRIRNHYSDSAGVFVPVQIDTLKALPRWCRGRRVG